MKYSFENLISVQFLDILIRWIRRSFWTEEQALLKYAGKIINMNMVEITVLSDTEQITRCLWMKALLLQLLTRTWSSRSEKELFNLNDGVFTLKMSAKAFTFWKISSLSYDHCTLCQIFHRVNDTSTIIHISEERESKWVLILYLVHHSFRFNILTTCQHSVLLLYLF